MAKFHIGKDGAPAPCNAQPGNCPLGGDNEHFTTQKEAEQFSDIVNEAVTNNKFLDSKTISNSTSFERRANIKALTEVIEDTDRKIQEEIRNRNKLRENKYFIEKETEIKDINEEKTELRLKRFQLDDYHSIKRQRESLLKKDLESKNESYLYKNENYAIEIDSSTFLQGKPKYTGYKLNNNGEKSEKVSLRLIPQEIVQKSFKSPENQKAFNKVKDLQKEYKQKMKNLEKYYPETKNEKEIKEIDEKHKVLIEKEKNIQNDKKYKEIQDNIQKSWQEEEKLKDEKKSYEIKQKEIKNFEEVHKELTNAEATTEHFLADSEESRKIFSVARENGVEDGVKRISGYLFSAKMADSLSQGEREEREIREKYNPYLNSIGINIDSFGNLEIL